MSKDEEPKMAEQRKSEAKSAFHDRGENEQARMHSKDAEPPVDPAVEHEAAHEKRRAHK